MSKKREQTTLLLDNQLSKDEKKLYKEAHKQCHPLKKNQLNLLAINFQETIDKITVQALLRSTIEKPIDFQSKTTIILYDDAHRPVLKETFNLTSLNPIEPNTARPFTFTFSKENLLITDFTLDANWFLAFERKAKKHKLDLRDVNFRQETIEQLQEIVKRLGPPTKNEMNIVGLSLRRRKQGIQAIVLLRNGTNKTIKIKQVPLKIITIERKTIVSQGTFTVENLKLLPHSSKPISFLFPEHSIRLKDIDLSTCTIVPNLP